MNLSTISVANNWNLSEHKTKAGQELPGNFAVALQSASSGSETSESKTASLGAEIIKKRDATKEFLEYMQMTPAERMQYAWLARHGISKEDFEAMSPDEQQKLLDKMKQEIELQAKMQMEKGQAKSVNILV